MKNSTKTKKQTAEKLREQMATTVGIWRGTADDLEKKAAADTEKMVADALYFAASIFRSCAVDLEGVVNGSVILSKTDTPFAPIPGIVNGGQN